jgi:uncharacterized protein (TIGR02118 family)
MSKGRSGTAYKKLSSKQYGRRELVVGAGKAAAVGAIAAALGSDTAVNAAAAESKATRCITVLYKNGDNVKFDFDYYKKNHLTMIMKLYGKSIRKFELRKGLTAQDGSKPQYVAVVNIWIADQAAFDAAGAKYSAKLVADVPNFTNTQAVVQNDEVYAVAES